MFGVLINGWPVQPSASARRSSTRIKTMLGRGAALTACAAAGCSRPMRNAARMAIATDEVVCGAGFIEFLRRPRSLFRGLPARTAVALGAVLGQQRCQLLKLFRL